MNKKSARFLVIGLIVIAVGVIWGVKSSESGASMFVSDLAIPLDITEEINIDNYTSANMPILIDFGADSCIPCKEMAPVLVKLNREMQEKARIHFVDVWKHPKLADGFPVNIIPTQVFYNPDGTPYRPSVEILQGIPGFKGYTDRNDNLIMTTHVGGLTEADMRLILADMGVQ